MEPIIQILAKELDKSPEHVENVVRLIDEGNTIPFIARYRKELHGAMDDTALRTLADRLQYLRNLDKRREEVKSAIEGQGRLTEELSAAIDAAATLAEVEDLYRPYRPKRRTRATVAREKGLEPLAQLLYAQEKDGPAPEEAAGDYVDDEKGVESVEDALQGASDIIAEWISDDADIRKGLRELVWRKGYLVSAAAAKEPEDTVYRLYYDFRSPLNRAMGLIGGKWKMQILCSLYNNGPTRYNQLKKTLDGVSNTVLANALRELEGDGLVKRREYLEVPVRVEYEITEPCRRLIPILDELGNWSLTVQTVRA